MRLGLAIHSPASSYLIHVYVNRQLIMNENTEAASPRRLVVYFRDFSSSLPAGMIQDDEGDRPQLFHGQRIDRPSAISRMYRRFFESLLKPRPTKASDLNQGHRRTVADAREFVTRNYRSGDQVILMTDQVYGGEHVIQPMEILARHLHDGTTPGEPSKAQPGGETNARARRIPIYAVAAMWWRNRTGPESMSLASDGLKSRFPSGIEHIACHWSFWNPGFGFSSCSTTFDLDGSIISREMSNYDSLQNWEPHRRLMHTTKHIIYYKPEEIPDWDTQEPVWTKVLDSSPSGIPRNFPSSTLPAGIYRQELRRYQGGPEYSDRLVWKSFRH